MKTIKKASNQKASAYNDFGISLPDGRLTAIGSNKSYRLREAILQSKRLGRPLTDEEMKQYEI